MVLPTYERSIAELKCLLNKASWQETLKNSEVSAKLWVHMDIFCHNFNIAFPCKSVCVSKWITQGTKISSRRICFMNRVKKNILSQDYIKNQLIYKRVLKEAKEKGK